MGMFNNGQPIDRSSGNMRINRLWWKLLNYLVITLVLLFLLAPIIVVVVASFNGTSYFAFPPEQWSVKWFMVAFQNSEYMDSLKASLIIAFFATLGASILGLPAAIGFSKSDFPGKAFIEQILLAPLALPVLVWALGLLQLFGRLQVRGNLVTLVAAHIILISPYIFRIVSASLAEYNKSLEDAAASLGASPWTTFWKVTLPLILPGVLVGAIFSFMISFTDLVLTLFISSSGFTTFPVRVYSEMRSEGINPMVFAYSTIIVVVVLILSIIGEKYAKWSRYM